MIIALALLVLAVLMGLRADPPSDYRLHEIKRRMKKVRSIEGRQK